MVSSSRNSSLRPDRSSPTLRVILCLAPLVPFLAVEPLLLSPGHYLVVGLLIAAVFTILVALRYSFLGDVLAWAAPLPGTLYLSAFFGGYPWNGVEYATLATTAVLLVVLLGPVDSDNYRRVLVGVFGGLGLIYLGSVLYGYFRQIEAFGWLGLYRFPVGSLRNPNTAGRVLGFLGLAVLVQGQRRTTRLLGLVLGLAALATGSRGVVLGFLAVATVWFLLRLPRRRRLLYGSLLILLALFLLLMIVGSPWQLTNLQRLQLVPESLQMVLDHPMGVGGWNFGLLYPQYSWDARWQRHPHSLPLWLLTAFGVPGFLVALGGGIWWTLRASLPREGFPLLFFGTHELVDTMLWIPGVLLLLALYLPVFLQSREPSRRHRGPGLVVGAILCLLLTGMVWASWQYRRGLTRAYRGNWAGAREVWTFQGTGFTGVHRAVALMRDHRPGPALRVLNRAARRNQLDPYIPYLRSVVLERMGRDEAAEQARREARRRDPHGMVLRDTRADSPRASPEPGSPRVHPRRAANYLRRVDRALERGDCETVFRQVRVLESFVRLSSRTRAELARRRATCYRIRGNESARSDWLRRARSFAQPRPPRPQFHRFFYRRPGLDHAYRR